ncbi:MAG: hypothetical protein Q8876_05720 [Bacillota bacterium]|nr:hypothetical protein [Bacillota bacterium]
MTQIISTNTFTTAKWIVSATASDGTHTTIQSAITSASSGDTIFIRPGTYTENLTLTAGVNLTAFGCDNSLNGTGKVIISGTCTLTTAGTVTISGIQLQTNSAALLAVTGTLASIVNLNNCYINCTNNTGITYSSSSASSAININNCFGDIGTTGISLFSASGAGNINMYNSVIGNSGSSSTASTVSAGSFNPTNSTIGFTTTTSSTGNFQANFCNIALATLNLICLTQGGNSGASANNTLFASGTASAITISTQLQLRNCQVFSSNTNAVTGAGTLVSAGTLFTGSSSKSNVTTQTGGCASGLTQGTAPSAGFVGEQIKSVVGATSVTLTNNTNINVTSISLTAGIWDVTGLLSINAGGNTFNRVQASISTTSATLGTAGDNLIDGGIPLNGIRDGFVCVPSYRITLSSTTTVYFVALVSLSAGGGTTLGGGRLSATRVG